MSDPISDSGRAKKLDDAEKRVKEFLDNADKGTTQQTMTSSRA